MSMPDSVRKLIADYNISKDEIWLLPGGKSYAIKHSAIERIAAQVGITFDLPQIIEGSSNDKLVVLMGVARLGDREEWSFGEAAPTNNKNAYPWAIAEKRLKDRLALKLLAVHGAVYSEDEADDFKQVGEPQPIRYDQDTPKKSSHAIKKDTPELWGTIVRNFREAKSYAELKEIAGSEYVQDATKDWPMSWVDALRDEFSTCATALRETA